MDSELWQQVYQQIERMDSSWVSPDRVKYTDGRIVEVYMWAVLRDRPTSWACRAENWPIDRRDQPLPDPSRMSRRLRSDSVGKFLAQLERRMGRTDTPASWVRWTDAKPLAIGGSSRDADAGYGRAASGMAKGYKLYAICDPQGRLCQWQVHGMNVNEKKVCRSLIQGLRQPGYLVGDGEYDSNYLYDLAGNKGIQLLSPRRRDTQLGHQYQSPYRLRSMDLQASEFGLTLLHQRAGIDRTFGRMGNFGGGMGPLPNWVRTLGRVRRWVRGKIIIYYAWLKIKRRNPAA